jgi:hypothetical protein
LKPSKITVGREQLAAMLDGEGSKIRVPVGEENDDRCGRVNQALAEFERHGHWRCLIEDLGVGDDA